jgi:sensor histidine kinase YesM
MKEKLKSLLLGWLIHYILVLAAMNLTYIIQYLDDLPHYVRRSPLQYFIKHTFHDADNVVLILSLLMIEINYQYLFKKLRLPFFVFTCLLVGVLSVTLLYYLNLSRFEGRGIPLQPLLYVAGYALVYSVIRDYLYTIKHKKEIQLQQSKNELHSLKAQLNPHFLFNSLNYLYGTALTEKAQNTADGIYKLSELMRYTITGTHENFVPLDNELKFIEQYVALRRVRIPQKESIEINVQITSPTKGLQIAPLLLLPFIENAFKYGINMDERSFVNIKIDVANSTLIMSISNSISRAPIEIEGNNTGIKNTINRLKLLYPDKYKLQQTNNGFEYTTLLTLELKSQ